MRKIHIQICSGDACSDHDSKELITLPAYLTDRENDRLSISVTPCFEHCQLVTDSKPPFVMINGVTLGEMGIEELVSVVKKKLQESDSQ